MYSYPELNKIFRRCMNMLELEKACAALLIIMNDDDVGHKKREYVSLQATIKFRQFNI